jgi:hypothetical protein
MGEQRARERELGRVERERGEEEEIGVHMRNK